MRRESSFDPGRYAAWRASPLGSRTERLELDLLFDLAGPVEGKSVLDAGSGDGACALEAARRGASVTALDVDTAMLTAARERAAFDGIDLMLATGRIEAMPFPDATFHVVLAMTVLCFVEDVEGAFEELARVLRPGGRLVVGELGRHSAWAAERRIRGWLGSPTWRGARFWTRGTLRARMAEAGLQVVTIRGAVHYPPLAAAARVLAPLDDRLGRLRAPCPAFLAAAADRPVVGS